ncbi:DNRLRE domain-containing protein, partial [Deltaproteobacteria bacterium]|nr:DNRLRE domain-containing protein [Deltaproteobacteria bacterium]
MAALRAAEAKHDNKVRFVYPNMDMLQTPPSSKKSAQALILVILFLFADLMVPQLYPASILQEDGTPSRVSTTWDFNVSIDTMIESSFPLTTHGSDGTALVGVDGASEGRMLLEFGLNLSSVQVHSATLNLECSQDDGESGFFQISNLTQRFNESNANWGDSNTSVTWDEMGAESSLDRSAWEPSLAVSNNGTVNLNVTRFVQQRVLNAWPSMRFIVAGTDSQYECYTSDDSNTSLHPTLSIEFSNNTAASIGSILPNWIEDGTSLMTGDFILTADTTPTMTWTSLSGDAVLVQVSGSEKFRMESDFGSHWSSIDDPSMFTLAGNGSMSINSSNALSNGSTVYYRMRAMNGDQIGEWQNGWFNLPAHDITDNGDGTATISIDADDLGLSEKTIWDVELDSSQKSTILGAETTMVVGTDTSPDKESTVMTKVNLQHLGLHTNVTIKSSEIIFTRDAVNGSELVSMIFVENHVDWIEEDATWNSPVGNSTDWDVEVGTVMDSISMDASNDEFSFNTTIWAQAYLDLGLDTVDIILSGQDANGSFSSSNDITFHSTEASTPSDQPRIEVTYEWGSSSPVSKVDLQYPIEGQGIWEIDDQNLSGNTTPVLKWNGSASSGNEILFQLSDDKLFRNILKEVDTSVDNDFQPSDGLYNITSGFGLSTGAMYYWRMAQVDPTIGRWSFWDEQSFFITDLNSTYLGDNKSQFTLRDGNASTDGKHPDCKDTYIDSGMPNTSYDDEEEMQVSYSQWGSTSILFGCQLLTHLLPSGFAVTEATLRFKQSYNSGNPYIGAYESNQHNWTEEGATWNSYDSRNSWGTAGAKGWERGQLLSSTIITSSSATWIEWNVTLGVQNSMRNGINFDVILAILGSGSGSDREALFYGNANSAASRAELVFTYVPGSSSIPDQPVPLSPANGSWSIEDGIEPKPIQNPLLNWNYTSNTNVSAFAIDIDSNTSFESADLLSYGSWTSSGFDLTNMTFQIPVDLDTATTWYWRVRGVSDTNQIGDWSQYNYFHIPDLTTWSIDNDTAAVELHHHEAMPSLQLPHFVDTWVADSGSDLNSSHGSASDLEIGERSDGSIATALMKIPIADFPMPQNATLKAATLNLYPEWGSSSDQRISIHALNGTWNENATGMTRDGSVNWSAAGASGVLDANQNFVDVQDVTPTNWMTFDITEIAQSVHASGSGYIQLLIAGDNDTGLVKITSVDEIATTSDKPWLNLTWTTGVQNTPESTAGTLLPQNGDILWNNSGVALLPSSSPTFEWTHANSSSIDAWRLFISEDYNDVRGGWVIHDSRDVLGFNLTTLEFTPTSNLSNGDSYRWFVQAIVDDVYGRRGNINSFHLPFQTGATLNSTDAYAVFQDGAFIPAASYPDVFKDTWLDQFNSNANHGSNSSLVVGDSPHSPSSSANTLIEINLSSIPIRNPYEVVNANLSLYKMGGGDSGDVNVSISPLLPMWSESTSSWNSRNS